MRVAVTGGAGFIGSNFVHYMLEAHPDDDVLVIDKLTYAGNLSNLARVKNHPRYRFVRQDICCPEVQDVLGGCDVIVHFAAETHVDRSIEDACPFVQTNVEGTWRLIEAARAAHVSRFVHVSTDEVYGSLGKVGRFTEQSSIAPNSPYAATKAAADFLILAAVHTYGFPAVITRCSNNYGPYQFPEKFIPLMISQAVAGSPLPLYGDGQHVRDWVHVLDHCRALDLVSRKGREGEIYNIGGDCEMTNLDVAKIILQTLERPAELVQFISDRPGHDRRYAMDCEKIQSQLGWRRQWDFSEGLRQTIAWYRSHGEWLDDVRSGTYRDYFDRHYTNREMLLRRVASSGDVVDRG